MSTVYPEDFFLLSRQITMRNIDEFLMQARIVSHPHSTKEAQEDFMNDLMEQREWFRGGEYSRDKLDREGLKGLKSFVKRESRFGKVRQKGDKKRGVVLE